MGYYIDAIRKYAVFRGRSSRKQFWMFFLFNFVIGLIFAIADAIVISMFAKSAILTVALGIVLVIYSLYLLAMILPSLAISVRRLHDANHSGWWVFIVLVPYIGAVALLIAMAIKGSPEGNRFGPKLVEA